MNKIIILTFLLLYNLEINGQSKLNYDSLFKVATRQLIHLEKINPNNPESKEDPYKYCIKTAQTLTYLFQDKRSLSINEKTFPNLDFKSSVSDSLFRVFNICYIEGAQGGPCPTILQWKKNNNEMGSYFLLNKKIRTQFSNAHKLNSISDKTLYLLIGYEKWGSDIKATAYVVQINSKGYLILDYPAFYNKPFMNFYNVEIEFQEENQTLKILCQNDVESCNKDNDKEILSSFKLINNEIVGQIKFDGFKFK